MPDLFSHLHRLVLLCALILLMVAFAAPQPVSAAGILFDIKVIPDRGTITTEFCVFIKSNLRSTANTSWWAAPDIKQSFASGQFQLGFQATESKCFILPPASPAGVYQVVAQVGITAYRNPTAFTVEEALPAAREGLTVTQRDAALPNTPWWFVQGGGYRADEKVSWWLDGPDDKVVRSGDVLANANGEFTVTIQRIYLTEPGEYTFAAKQGNDPAQSVKFQFIQNEANTLPPDGTNGNLPDGVTMPTDP